MKYLFFVIFLRKNRPFHRELKMVEVHPFMWDVRLGLLRMNLLKVGNNFFLIFAAKV